MYLSYLGSPKSFEMKRCDYLLMLKTVRMISESAKTMQSTCPICIENTFPYFSTNFKIVSCGFTGLINGKYPNTGKPQGPGGNLE